MNCLAVLFGRTFLSFIFFGRSSLIGEIVPSGDGVANLPRRVEDLSPDVGDLLLNVGDLSPDVGDLLSNVEDLRPDVRVFPLDVGDLLLDV